MLLLVGLGNPGAHYVGNRHNIGFLAVQEIAKRHGIGPWRRRFQGLACEGPLGGVRTLLLLPGTYMNESGRAVAEAVHFYKLAAVDVSVFHDEIDLPPGKVRVKISGACGSELVIPATRMWCSTMCSVISRKATAAGWTR